MVADKSLAAEIEAELEECNIDRSRDRMGFVTVNDRRTGRDHEVLAREAEFASAAILRQGAKVVVIREMLTARVRVILAAEIDGGHFESVDPGEPVERARLHVVPKAEEGR